MTTYSNSLNAFALAARHGRTIEPLSVLSYEVVTYAKRKETQGKWKRKDDWRG